MRFVQRLLLFFALLTLTGCGASASIATPTPRGTGEATAAPLPPTPLPSAPPSPTPLPLPQPTDTGASIATSTGGAVATASPPLPPTPEPPTAEPPTPEPPTAEPPTPEPPSPEPPTPTNDPVTTVDGATGRRDAPPSGVADQLGNFSTPAGRFCLGAAPNEPSIRVEPSVFFGPTIDVGEEAQICLWNFDLSAPIEFILTLPDGSQRGSDTNGLLRQVETGGRVLMIPTDPSGSYTLGATITALAATRIVGSGRAGVSLLINPNER